MKCPNCQSELTQEMIDVNMCWECGQVLNLENAPEDVRNASLLRDKMRKIESDKQAYAKSFNENYEYDVVTIISEHKGTVDTENMKNILNEHASEGWKLHTIYSNELGKNALMILGFGVNSTVSEDVMIFERRIR